MNQGTGASIVGVLGVFAGGIIVVAAIYQLNKGAIPSTAGSTTKAVVSDLFTQ